MTKIKVLKPNIFFWEMPTECHKFMSCNFQIHFENSFMIIWILTVLLLASSLSDASGQTKDNLYVFVGEKIEISDFQPNKVDHLFDNAVRAKYKVIQNIYGNYKQDTIEFEAYFHCGGAIFSKFKNVLLFVSNYNGRLYLEKYQYFDVYKTIDGRWASPGDTSKFDRQNLGNFKPQHLQFIDTVWYDIRQLDRGCLKRIAFSEPYFRIEGNKAIALMGTYVDELFLIRKEYLFKKDGTP